MEQARHYVCHNCGTHVPREHRFCGSCGAPVPQNILEPKFEFFGAMQAPGRARLVVIRGEGNIEGLSYLLQGDEHLVGRDSGEILFPEDPWVSRRHAKFVYRDKEVFVADEGSENGVFLRIRNPVALNAKDCFLCGEQLFQVHPILKDDAGPAEDGTFFYASPRRPSAFCVSQLLMGGDSGMVYCAREQSLMIGRDECDMNFPNDLYMSGRHAKVELTAAGDYLLSDQASKNGTYLKIQGEHKLVDGDYLFIGKQLLRVEVTP